MNIRENLEQMARMKEHIGVHPFERWLLENGEQFGELVDVEEYGGFGIPKECYSNAANALMGYEMDSDEWFYVEGVMLLNKLPILIEHAWLANRDGQVLDFTSRDANENGAQYWGVPYALPFLRRSLCEHGIYGLHNNGVHYMPVTTRPLPAEARAWPINQREAA
jgi:hypothetical protein